MTQFTQQQVDAHNQRVKRGKADPLCSQCGATFQAAIDACYDATCPMKRTNSDMGNHISQISKPRLRQSNKPLMNKLETGFFQVLKDRGYFQALAQAITLRLDPPFKSYRPDFATIGEFGLVTFWETKGPHRFREKGIAKVALAAKTYPQFNFILVEWKDGQWKETTLK